jgi:cardiolipin synthase
MMIDRAVVSSGSANFNHRSLGKDEECNVNILSRELAKTLAGHFDADLKHAEAIDPRRWTARPASLKLRENLARLVREQL